MGSAPSSNVKSIQLDQSSLAEDARPSSGKSLRSLGDKFKLPAGKRRATEIELEDCRRQLETREAELSQAQCEVQEAQQKAAKIEQQMAEAEGQNLELLDQVQNLQEQLQILLDRQAEPEPEAEECSETLKVKDQYIQKLEQEVKVFQEENTKLKTRYKKKIKLLNGKLAESKHESSLEIHDLKSTIYLLQEEKDKMTEDLRQMEIHGTPSYRPGSSISHDADKTKIVLELSARISEQEDIINNLEKELSKAAKENHENSMKVASAKRERMVSSSKTGSRTKYIASPRSGSESNILSALKIENSVQNKTQVKDIDFNEETHWCGKVEDTPRDNSESHKLNGNNKFSTWSEDNEQSEFKEIAKEMKKLQSQRRRKARKSQPEDLPKREASALSRDSGVNVDLENPSSAKENHEKLPKTYKSPRKANIGNELEVPSSLSTYGSETSLNNLLAVDDLDTSETDKIPVLEVKCIEDSLSQSRNSIHENVADRLIDSVNKNHVEPFHIYEPAAVPSV